jgi:hypothetical protein
MEGGSNGRLRDGPGVDFREKPTVARLQIAAQEPTVAKVVVALDKLDAVSSA